MTPAHWVATIFVYILHIYYIYLYIFSIYLCAHLDSPWFTESIRLAVHRNLFCQPRHIFDKHSLKDCEAPRCLCLCIYYRRDRRGILEWELQEMWPIFSCKRARCFPAPNQADASTSSVVSSASVPDWSSWRAEREMGGWQRRKREHVCVSDGGGAAAMLSISRGHYSAHAHSHKHPLGNEKSIVMTWARHYYSMTRQTVVFFFFKPNDTCLETKQNQTWPPLYLIRD